jgi:hypothetical protein
MSKPFKTHGEESREGFGGNNRRKATTIRPRRRWEDNINMDLREIEWDFWTTLSCLRIGTNGGLL